jgi:hypothetical protein
MMTPWVSQRNGVRPRRRGITMIEMVVLMTGVAAMLGLCTVLLQLFMKLDADSRARVQGASAAARLAEQFRLDVHSARSARLVDGAAGGKAPVGLRLEPGADRTIDYQVKGIGIVQRVESRKGAPPHRERYEVPHTGPVKLLLEQEKSGPTFATLAMDREVAMDRTETPRAVEVTALVGKNMDRISAAGKTAGAKP